MCAPPIPSRTKTNVWSKVRLKTSAWCALMITTFQTATAFCMVFRTASGISLFQNAEDACQANTSIQARTNAWMCLWANRFPTVCTTTPRRNALSVRLASWPSKGNVSIQWPTISAWSSTQTLDIPMSVLCVHLITSWIPLTSASAFLTKISDSNQCASRDARIIPSGSTANSTALSIKTATRISLKSRTAVISASRTTSWSRTRPVLSMTPGTPFAWSRR